DFMQRHPFDVELLRVPPGAKPYPYHAHSTQWEFYIVVSGTGVSRDDEGKTPIGPGDALLYKPGEAHQFINDGDEDLLVYVIANNPFNDTAYYPDSQKWSVKIPQRRLLRGENLDYFDGEE
ncbi:MAG: cupin domain-containing protein, partial [Candidatus Eremiobacteraeota bacterium]|nr:cupin domain-containing protein [Candidatus Eremiobacteraeota bacterium]